MVWTSYYDTLFWQKKCWYYKINKILMDEAFAKNLCEICYFKLDLEQRNIWNMALMNDEVMDCPIFVFLVLKHI